VVPGVVATTIFAIPPAVRLTDLGIRQVDPEVVEAAHAFGAHPRQILHEVQLPMAMPSIMAGINQVITLALSMVVVAGLAGATRLGAVVVSAVTQLDVAAGFEAASLWSSWPSSSTDSQRRSPSGRTVGSGTSCAASGRRTRFRCSYRSDLIIASYIGPFGKGLIRPTC